MSDVTANPRHTLGVDIGGTKTAVGVVDGNGLVLAREVFPTPKESAERLVTDIAQAARTLEQSHPFTSIGVAVAALTNTRQQRIPFATYLPLRNVAFTEMLQAATGHQVSIDNDATAAMWGEWIRGAAKGTQDCVMISVGTGIGGGMISNGQLQRGHNGMAGEIGHLRLVPAGITCGCGLSGCWEQYASGQVLDRWAAENIAAKNEFGALLVDQAGSAEAVTGRTISQLANAGVATAIDYIAQIGENLGAGMGSLAAILDPEAFVIGGGLIDLGELLLEPTRVAFETHFFAAAYRELPVILPAQLGPDAALIGAADLASR